MLWSFSCKAAGISPPRMGSPHVTTDRSSKIAQNAPSELWISTTRLIWCWTLLLSPPACLSPQVTTDPSSLIAAKANMVACKHRTFWSWVCGRVPPKIVSPQATTELSSKTAAKLRCVACISLTFSFKSGPWPPSFELPQQSTPPSVIAAKASSLDCIFRTFVNLDWTLLLSPPYSASPQVITLPLQLSANAALVAARIIGPSSMAKTSKAPFPGIKASESNKRPDSLKRMKLAAFRIPSSWAFTRTARSRTNTSPEASTITWRPLGKKTVISIWGSQIEGVILSGYQLLLNRWNPEKCSHSMYSTSCSGLDHRTKGPQDQNTTAPKDQRTRGKPKLRKPFFFEETYLF